ncbi:MAG TPA: hypothetical protein VGE40_10840, partial [Bacilli bacterium]
MRSIKSSIKRYSIYTKLVFTFLLVIVPMYVLSLAMNQSGTASVRNEIMQSMQSTVHFYQSSFEHEINRISTLKKEYVTDEDLQNLSHIAGIMSDYDRRRATLN